MEQRNTIQVITQEGYLITGTRVLGSKFWTFKAYEPVSESIFAPSREPGNRMFEGGVQYEEIGTAGVVLQALGKPPTEFRAKMHRLKEEQYSRAYTLIVREFPQTASGIRREGKIEVELEENP